MATFLTDEHVPSVFVTTLRSNGHEVILANDVFGESTDDRALLEHCATEGYVFVSNDKKDFTGTLPADVDHAGVLLSTDPNYPRTIPRALWRPSSEPSLTIRRPNSRGRSSGSTGGVDSGRRSAASAAATRVFRRGHE